MDTLIYKGFLNLVKREVDGRTYEVLKSKKAVAAVIVNEHGDRVLLVRQMRPALMKEIWEIPAGMMDVTGEDLRECMARELLEEAEVFIDPRELNFLIGYHPHVGCCDAHLSIYYGTAEQTYVSKQINDADVIEARWFTQDEVFRMIGEGDVVDGKTIIGCLKAF